MTSRLNELDSGNFLMPSMGKVLFEQRRGLDSIFSALSFQSSETNACHRLQVMAQTIKYSIDAKYRNSPYHSTKTPFRTFTIALFRNRHINWLLSDGLNLFLVLKKSSNNLFFINTIRLLFCLLRSENVSVDSVQPRFGTEFSNFEASLWFEFLMTVKNILRARLLFQK